MLSIHLPTPQGIMTNYPLVTTEERPTVITPAFNRIAYAAAHVVIDPQHQGADWLNNPRIDWDATLAYRHHLWRLGFNIAEAMDTAQRGMGVSWEIAKELIIRSLQEAQTVPGSDLAAGVGTDQLEAAHATTLEQVIAAYEEQMELVEQHNGKIILMASRALAKVAKTPQDYLAVYNRLLEQSQDKIILHWLGEMFDPALAGYWGSTDFAAAADTVLEIIANNVDKVEPH